MAYRPSPIGTDVHYGDQAAAAARLTKLYARYGTRVAVARAAGVDVATLGRWLRRLAQAGYVVEGRPAAGRPRNLRATHKRQP